MIVLVKPGLVIDKPANNDKLRSIATAKKHQTKKASAQEKHEEIEVNILVYLPCSLTFLPNIPSVWQILPL